ncbi:MAG: type II secretion system F family protein [Bdellovibrionota bacterium]
MKYKYEGYDRSARVVRGEVEAGTLEDVRSYMRSQSLSPRSITPISARMSLVNAVAVNKKPELKDFTIFIRQWSTMQSAGLTLIQCLSVLGEQTPNPAFARTLNSVVKEIQEGQTLTQALSKQTGVFDKIFINLIGAGEGSGTLDRILDRLAVYYEKMASIRRKVVTATIYPSAILVIVFGIITGLLIFVVPMFEKMFADQGKELPQATQLLLAVSQFIRQHVIIMGAAVGGIIFLIGYIFTNEEARAKIDPVLLHLPIFGNILQKSCLARFCRTLGTLIQAGVPILDAFNLAAKVSGNYEIEGAAMRVQASVKEGSSISAPLALESSFPRMVVSMISVGEQTGELEKMLMKVAEFYEDEVDTSVSAMTSILEPMLIVIMGIVVVSVLIPLYLPIFNLGDLMGN